MHVLSSKGIRYEITETETWNENWVDHFWCLQFSNLNLYRRGQNLENKSLNVVRNDGDRFPFTHWIQCTYLVDLFWRMPQILASKIDKKDMPTTQLKYFQNVLQIISFILSNADCKHVSFDSFHLQIFRLHQQATLIV